MIHFKSFVSLLLIQLLLIIPLASAHARSFPGVLVPDAVDSTASREESRSSASEETVKGLRFRLSEGAAVSEQQPEARVAPATRLSESEAENVLKRLPPVKAEALDEQDFALRERSLPPPRTGKTINAVFPPPVEIVRPDVTANAGLLEVLRHSPEGEVPLAPQLSVTFSQPMVAVTSQAELAAGDVPVRLTPQPRGRWRWVGTKTLLFEPDVRFPMATVYQASVAAGTRSATGAGALAKTSTWTFSTPPPQIKTKYPEGGPQRRDALVFLEFDQRIDASAVLRTIKVSSEKTNLNVRLATPQEIEADETVGKLAASAEKDRWIALRAVSPSSTDARTSLPGDANITVTVGPGTPSAEGPRTTTKAETFSFRTFGPLRVVTSECGYNNRCTPFDAWRITFTNPLDDAAFQKSSIRVEPEVTGIKTTIYGDTLNIEGLKKGRKTYKVTLDKTIRDQFGQNLGMDATVTFNVGPAPQSLTSMGEGFVTLDPSGPPRFSIFSINHDRLKVSLYKVGPEHWEKFTAYMRFAQGYTDDASRKQQTPPGSQVFSKEVAIKSAPDEIVETGIDLSPALESGLGQAIIIVEPLVQPKNRWERRYIRAWVQATQIGLDAFVDRTDLVGWANSLKDGHPLGDVQMRVWPSEQMAKSGADGVARIALPSTSTGLNLLVAQLGSDLAILPEHAEWWSREGGWHRRETSDSLRWYVFDDRKMYRPGEEVHIKGWVRRIGGGKDGDVGPLDGAATNVSYILKDSRDNEITKGNLSLNALGGFDTVLKLPGTMNLGSATMAFEAGGGSQAASDRQFSHDFQVQEFRRPEFEVKAQASEGPHIVGGHADASVSAAYYAGGGLPNTEVSWRVTSTPANYTPPNRDDYTFGKWVPWWSARGTESESRTETFQGRTDAAGKHHLRIDFDSVNPPRASSVLAEASVTDVNRQTWSSSTSMLVHPSDLYVGLRSDRYFVQQGEPLVVQSIVTDIDGKLIAGRPIRMRAVLLDWTYKNGEWQQEETNAQDCTINSSVDAVKCTFTPKTGGTYRVTARIMDDRERPNESELTLWVAGGKTPPKREVEQETVEMIPDRKDYKPGDTAEILVQAPFYPAEGVLTLRRSGIIKSERFRMDGPTMTLKVPIEERFIPNLYVQVDLVGAAARTDDAGKADERLPKRPAYAKGELNLSIPPMERKLLVEATPRDKALEPGAETVVNVEVRDAQSRPVAGSEVAVVVVDESVLALTNYKLEDPLSIFYAQRSADVSDYHLREKVLLGNPKVLAELAQSGGGVNNLGTIQESVSVSAGAAQAPPAPPMASPVAGLRKRSSNFRADGADNNAAPINLRENFNALAVFAASVPTDAQGRAEVKVKVPDNLTRYRVMAVSVAGGKQFGAGESAITARQPLMVRPSAPRFLNFGDRFELPIVLQNQTDSPMTVDVAVRATNAELTDGAGRRVVVPANDRTEVRLPVAASRAGTARFQMAAASGGWADAAEISLPVWTPATTEAFATYGELDEGAITQPVRAPADVVKQFGGLEITTSSTQLQELTDAVLYLMAYPYECSEQISSRVLAVAALRDVLTAFAAKDMPTPEEMKAAVARDIKRLQGLQRDDGGFGFWRRDEESWPYVSIHVAHAIERAREKKFEVPDGMLDKSKAYLRNIEKHIPGNYPVDVRRALIAYALYVRNRMGDRDAARARKLITEAGLENLSLEAVGWLLPVLSGDAASKLQVEAIRVFLNNRASETAATAHFTTSYTDGEYLLLHSARRADGIILEALIGDQPSSDLIPKIVRGLLANRTAGRWENTQENVFILLALDRYFATYEKATPDFVARAWLGDRFAGEKQYKGRSTERQQVNVPMRYLLERQGDQNLVLSKTGPGRLYYRIGMQYAPASLKLNAADYGFTVERVYEAIDNPTDVRRDAEGIWHIKAGAQVRVRLTMAAPARRYHVALVDPLPAGLESLNPALAVTGSIPQDERMEIKGSQWWWWSRVWFEHQNLRDERAEAFTSLLWEGVYTYSYVARATTPGNFVVPPAKAEEMYHPETFGRSSSDRVRIE